MGRWGYYPEDGDGPLDLLGDLTNLVWKDLRARAKKLDGTKESRYLTDLKLDFVGAVRIIENRWQRHVPYSILQVCVRYLDDVIRDETFVASYRIPKQSRKTIELAREEYRLKIEEHRGRLKTKRHNKGIVARGKKSKKK